MSKFHEGQRWISETEPELGLGTVMEGSEGRVQVIYPATGEVRVYSQENAPLRRITFRVGETIEDQEGTERVVDSINDEESVITYCGGGIAASSDAFLLTLLGHEDVAVYDASLSEWAADESLPMESA